MILKNKKHLISIILIIGLNLCLGTLTTRSFAGEKVVKLKVAEMYCWGCAGTVKQTLEGLKDVAKTKIDLDNGIAYVYAKNGKTLDANVLIAALKKAGYKATKVS